MDCGRREEQQLCAAFKDAECNMTPRRWKVEWNVEVLGTSNKKTQNSLVTKNQTSIAALSRCALSALSALLPPPQFPTPLSELAPHHSYPPASNLSPAYLFVRCPEASVPQSPHLLRLTLRFPLSSSFFLFVLLLRSFSSASSSVSLLLFFC